MKHVLGRGCRSTDAPKIILTPTSTAARGKNRGRGVPRKEVQPVQRRVEQKELHIDHVEEFDDSNKENEEVVEDQAPPVDMDDGEE